MADEIKKTEEPKAEDLIAKANAAAAKLETANKRAEELASINILGGRSEAGIVPKPADPVELEKERLRGIWKGTAIKIV